LTFHHSEVTDHFYLKKKYNKTIQKNRIKKKEIYGTEALFFNRMVFFPFGKETL